MQNLIKTDESEKLNISFLLITVFFYKKKFKKKEIKKLQISCIFIFNILFYIETTKHHWSSLPIYCLSVPYNYCEEIDCN